MGGAMSKSNQLISYFLATLISGAALSYGAAGAQEMFTLEMFTFMRPPISEPVPQTLEHKRTDESENVQLPAHLQKLITDYPTREMAGTIIIDTRHTFLYYVLGNGKAIRYGIGIGREGFTWSGVKSIEHKTEWPDWYPPVEMIARQPYLPRMVAGGPGNPSVLERCTSLARNFGSTVPTIRLPSASTCRVVAFASPTTTSLISTIA